MSNDRWYKWFFVYRTIYILRDNCFTNCYINWLFYIQVNTTILIRYVVLFSNFYRNRQNQLSRKYLWNFSWLLVIVSFYLKKNSSHVQLSKQWKSKIWSHRSDLFSSSSFLFIVVLLAFFFLNWDYIWYFCFYRNQKKRKKSLCLR